MSEPPAATPGPLQPPVEGALPPAEGPLPPELKPSHGCLIFIVAVGAMLLLAVVATLVMLGSAMSGDERSALRGPDALLALASEPSLIIVSTVAGQLGLLLVVLLVPAATRVPATEALGWRPIRPGVLLLAGVGCLAFSLLGDAAVAGLQALGLQAPSSLARILAALSALSLPARVAIAVGAALLPACCEELLFRGVLLTAWLPRWGPRAAILVTSLLFGLIHFDGVQSVSATIMGLYLGLLRYRSGSVWPCVAAHAANNAVAGLVLFGGGEVGLEQSLGLPSLVGGLLGLLALRGVRRPAE
ncbi:MAG: CPBP family intramembrane metalloprotease [Fimbriimonadaceae bacterium]|nr:CPBP family intramembrane metalloprotease [Fimbriimonadaceae bacterium]